MRCTISYDKVTHTHTHTNTNLTKHRESWILPFPAPDPFLLPSLPTFLSPRPPSLLSPRPPGGGRGEGVMGGNVGHGVVILGHGGLFWGSWRVMGWVAVIFGTRYRPSVSCTWFLPNFVEFRQILDIDLGDEKIVMPNKQLLSYLFDYWAALFFEYISVSGAERGSFWSKKKFKKLINKDFRAFFLKTDFIFSRPQFSKKLISETGYGSRVTQRYYRKKMGG